MCRSPNNNAPPQPTSSMGDYCRDNAPYNICSDLPTEAQLTLLCLDYLRSLRRSFQNPQDLLNGEGLHADYISLAIWSLSRAFVSPELKFGAPKVSTIIEGIVGGGGLAGVEDECVGNDSFYRILNESSIGGDGNDDDKIATPTPKEMFALTNDIKLPSMKDITNEILLSYTKKAKNEECPIYEHNDRHLSNSHRFYLFNGMANQSNDGEPLTLTDLTSVALSTLNAKSRVEAEQEVEQDPLFESFLRAADQKGFFNEKKLDGADALSPEEEERRQRLLYENKYRKVVAKYRSKLAATEEEKMSNGPLWAQRALANVQNVPDRLEMRREKIIELVKEYRVDVDESHEEEASCEELIGHIADEAASERVVDLGEAIEKLEGDIIEYEEGKVELKSENKLLFTIAANKEAALAKAAEDLSALQNSIEELQVDIAGHLEDKKKMQSEIEALTAVVAAANVVALEKSIEELKDDIMGHVGDKERMKSEIEVLNAVVAANQIALAKADVDIASLNKVIEEEQASIEALQDKLHTATEEIAKMQDIEKELKRTNTALQGDNSCLKGEMDKTPSDSKEALLDEETASYETLKADVDKLTAANAALSKSVEDLKLAKSSADKSTKTQMKLNIKLERDLKKALKMIVKMDPNGKNLIKEAFTASKDHPLSPKKTRKQLIPPSMEKAPDEAAVSQLPLTPQKSTSKESNHSPDKAGGVAYHPPPRETGEPFNPPSTKNTAAELPFLAPILQEAEEVNAKGKELMQKKQYSQALQFFTAALELSDDGPNSHIYYSNRGAAYVHLGQYSDAAEDCLASIELNDSYEDAYTNYGLCLFHMGDIQGSVYAQKKSFDLARKAYRLQLSASSTR
jgi:tetratricopeptide (TPR) repeat protein